MRRKQLYLSQEHTGISIQKAPTPKQMQSGNDKPLEEDILNGILISNNDNEKA